MVRLLEFLLSLFIFLIPWQARFILRAGEMHGGFWEYGTVALYATDVLFLVIVALSGVWWLREKIQNSEFRIQNWKTVCMIFIIVTYILFSIFWSFDKSVAVYSVLKLLEGIGLFFIVRRFLLYRNLNQCSEVELPLGSSTSTILWAFVASAVVQSVLAITQFFTQSVFAWPFSGIAPQDPSDLGVSVVQFADERWLRAYGSFPHPNLLGAFFAIALIIVTPLIPLILRGRRGKFWLLVTSYLLLVTGLFLTFSRAAWIAFLLGLIIYAVQTKAWKEKIFLQFVLLLVVTATILTTLFFPLVRTRVGGGSRLEIQSNQERTTGYREAVQLIKRHPFLGVGIGNYTAAVARELRSNDPVWSYQPAHNVFLLILSELGILGLVLVFGFVWQIKKFIIHNSYFIIPLLILSLFDHSLWTLHSGILISALLFVFSFATFEEDTI